MNLEDAKPGMHVRYIPLHAHGDRGHPDCEDGVVTSTNDKFIFVKFRLTAASASATAACDPEDLVRTA